MNESETSKSTALDAIVVNENSKDEVIKDLENNEDKDVDASAADGETETNDEKNLDKQIPSCDDTNVEGENPTTNLEQGVETQTTPRDEGNGENAETNHDESLKTPIVIPSSDDAKVVEAENVTAKGDEAFINVAETHVPQQKIDENATSTTPGVENAALLETPSSTIADTHSDSTHAIVGRRERLTAYKIFVKNLAFGTSEEELQNVFETFGKVLECRIFRDTLAFVHMEDEICGKNAILMLNAKLINGRCIGVEESKDKSGPSIPSTRIRVCNVPSGMSTKNLKDLFSEYGMIISVEILDTEATVTIEAVADVRSAIKNLNGHDCGNGQQLAVCPILNTAISYNPRKLRPPPPCYVPSRPRPTFSPGQFGRPRFPGPQRHYRVRGWSPDNPEGRVLRDPYGEGPSASRPRSPFMIRQRLPPPRHTLPEPPVPIEPLFFKRHNFLGRNGNGNSAEPNSEVFYEDMSLDMPSFSQPPPPPRVMYSPGPPPPPPPPRVMYPAVPPPPPPPPQPRVRYDSGPPHPHFRPRFPMKRGVPEAEAGEPFQAPSMIHPNSFVPPKKYFANQPKRPRKKNTNKELRPQPPIPEEPHRHVPDFSSYYTLPDTSVLRPFPAPPAPPDSDFYEDANGQW